MYCSYHIVPLYCSLVLMKASLCVGFLAFETFTFPHTILVSQDVSELAHKLHIDQQIALLEKMVVLTFLCNVYILLCPSANIFYTCISGTVPVLAGHMWDHFIDAVP